MDSPIIYSLISKITWDVTLKKPVYLQLADSILEYIKEGKLAPGYKLPGSRILAGILKINRITANKAYQELETQGWLEFHIGKGTFVASLLPEVSPGTLKEKSVINPAVNSGFKINGLLYPEQKFKRAKSRLHLDDGLPDSRLVPLKELSAAYRSLIIGGNRFYSKFGSYDAPSGSFALRNALSEYLNYTRGLKTTFQNILPVNGTVMGLNLVCNGLISPGDVIVYGVPGWIRAEANFIHSGAELIGIPVDEYGMVTDELKKICEKKKVRLVYITPHHHYPTTVSLRIDRRLELLKLSEEYGFIIFEDDYDFDFHYRHRPLLPLASADEQGMVIYCGSFSKIFSPAFRLGYLAASQNVIEHLSQVRLILDRQGNQILETAMAELLDEGIIQRYLKKTVEIYRKRRDYFCQLLQTHLKDKINFTIPEGGMTVWAQFEKGIDLIWLSQEAEKKDLYLSDGTIHHSQYFKGNCTRLGFSSSTEEELEQSVEILKNLLKNK